MTRLFLKDSEVNEGPDAVGSLLDSMTAVTVDFCPSEFNIDSDEESLSATYYYQVLHDEEGVGSSPTIADSVFVQYEVYHLNDNTEEAKNPGGYPFRSASLDRFG